MKAVTMVRFSSRALMSALLSALLLTSCGGGGNGATQSDEPAAADVGRVTALAASQSVSSIRTVVTTLTKVGETRVSRTVYDYVFQISVRNDGDAQAGVVATLTSTGLGTTIIDGGVVIGDLAANAVVTPSDTITLRQDRSQPFNTGALIWNIRSVPAVPGFVSVVAPNPATAVSINGFLSAPNILLIRFKTGVTPQQMAQTIAAAGGSVVGQVPLTMLVQARFDGAWTEARATALISQLAALAFVEGASLDKFTVPNSAPNDPWSSAAVWDDRFDTGHNWRIKAIYADAAWKRLYDSGRTIFPVSMGVTDNGFRMGHEDLQHLQTVNVQAPETAASAGNHGMHVAGIMAAQGNNNVGIAGVAWKGNSNRIYAYDYSSGTDATINAGIAELLKSSYDVRVINISAGIGYQDSEVLIEGKPPTLAYGYKWLPPTTCYEFYRALHSGRCPREQLKFDLRHEALLMFNKVLRRLVWKATFTMGGRSRSLWACGQVA